MMGAGLLASGGGVPVYLTESADFDGTNDYMKTGAGLTGAADGKVGTVSCWFRLDGGDAANLAILCNATTVGGGTNRFLLYRDNSNKIRVDVDDSAGANVLVFISNATYTAGASWHHLLASWDLAASRFQLYVDDVADTAIPSTLTDTAIDYTVADWAIGALPGSSFKFNGCFSEFYFNTVASLDLSVQSNRRKFRDASGKPVNLGANGSTPTGAQPIIYQKVADGGSASDFATNLGSGGNFTITGALTLGSDSPSD
jgi:hypothetical protein